MASYNPNLGRLCHNDRENYQLNYSRTTSTWTERTISTERACTLSYHLHNRLRYPVIDKKDELQSTRHNKAREVIWVLIGQCWETVDSDKRCCTWLDLDMLQPQQTRKSTPETGHTPRMLVRSRGIFVITRARLSDECGPHESKNLFASELLSPRSRWGPRLLINVNS